MWETLSLTSEGMPSPLGRMVLEDAHLQPWNLWLYITWLQKWMLLEHIRTRPGFRPQSLCQQNCRPLQEAEQCEGRLLGWPKLPTYVAALWVKEPQSQDSGWRLGKEKATFTSAVPREEYNSLGTFWPPKLYGNCVLSHYLCTTYQRSHSNEHNGILSAF